MFRRDKFIPHGGRLTLGGVENSIHIGSDVEPLSLPAAGDRGDLMQLPVSGGGKAFGADFHLPQELGDQTAVLPQQSQQQVDGMHFLMIVGSGQILGTLDSFQRFLGVVIKIHLRTLLSDF